MGVLTRGLRADEAAIFTALVERAGAAGELAGSSITKADWFVRFALAEPELVGVAVDEPTGRIVGWVHPEAKALVVEPAERRRGTGGSLVAYGLRMEATRGRPNLLLGVPPDDDGGHAFLRATGFELHSILWDLELAPGIDVVAPAWPAGVRPRAFDRDADLDAWVELFNAAFADHATPLQLNAARMREEAEWTELRDEDLLLVEEEGSGALVGFCSVEPRRLPDGRVEPRAEIWTIGVRPDRQGRGLGRQLLRWGVGYLRGLGVETVTLSVNGRNPRALGLYEDEGFTRTSTRERWARPVAPA